MVQKYELYFIINHELDATANADLIKNVTADLEANGAKEVVVTEEGVKRLAYPIKKRWNGFYCLINFEMDLTSTPKIKELEKKLNLNENIIRYIIVNQTEFLVKKAKETLKEVEIKNHRDFNKGKKQKSDLSEYLGIRAVDYKDVDYLSQFASPYSKIFVRTRTGNSAKSQRKITKAIKRARHMALMSFTPKHTA
jgi:ribosomal protein S6/ribosomal protein S18